MSDLRDALKRTKSKPLREALERGFAKESDRRRREALPTFRAWMGPWEAATAYKVGDVVEHLGSSLRCLVAHTDSEPPSPAWELVAQRGQTGPSGERGPPGAQGAQGLPGAGAPPSATVVTEQTFGQADTPGVSAVYSRGDHTHGTPPTPPGSALEIEDEGVALGPATTVDFVGAGVSSSVAGGMATVTIPGGGGAVVFANPVESQFGDVTSGGGGTDSARSNHVHDRRDDAVLFLTRMI